MSSLGLAQGAADTFPDRLDGTGAALRADVSSARARTTRTQPMRLPPALLRRSLRYRDPCAAEEVAAVPDAAAAAEGAERSSRAEDAGSPRALEELRTCCYSWDARLGVSTGREDWERAC